ncbi:MAG: hypothetical protein KatS3mg129_1218 [Leptospiraceae bacterium]|nr:MAG: hypothetical protein KatS3mg129_1218 [Leptospiraceae bacterium]
MKNKILIGFLYGILVLSLGGLLNCATTSKAYHEYVMKGSVVGYDDSIAGNGKWIICIGKKDGAKVGQILNAYRTKVTQINKIKKYEKIPVGKVRIDEIIDDHYAKVSIVEGTLEANDIVEIQL